MTEHGRKSVGLHLVNLHQIASKIDKKAKMVSQSHKNEITLDVTGEKQN